jgi:hypothetical protein
MVLRPRATIATVITVLGLLAASAATAWATVVLDPIAPVSSEPAWTVGNALGRTQAWLQTAWATDCPPPSGACATDSGPYTGVFWSRAATGPSPAWSQPARISQHRRHASRPTLAASGTDVYVAWVTRRSYLHPKPSSPRLLWVRASSDEGDHWGTPIRLSALGGRVDFPVAAASGSDARVVWTNADSGAIRMASSIDDGQTWTTTAIGQTDAGASSVAGFRGFPAIGASGADTMAAWIDDDAGRIVALTSTVGGSDWSSGSTPTELIGSGPHGGSDYPAVRGADDGASTNVAVAYATRDGIEARVFDGSALSRAATVAGPWPTTIAGHRYDDGYGPAVAPFGPEGLAVSWAACRHRSALRDPCSPGALRARIDVVERESSDGGSTWSSFVRLALAHAGAGIDEAPSIEAGAAGARWFLWLHRNARWSSYVVQGRSATAS